MTANVYEIIMVIFGAYLLYYVREKGKNQATKEDLKEITDTVEEVKRKYTEENELLRANLNILTSKKNIMFTEEKEAIVQYFAQLNKWIWHDLNVQILKYNHNNYNEMADILNGMWDGYNNTNITFSKVQLLCQDDELISVGHDANIKTLELHHFKENIVKKIQVTLSWEKIMVDQFLSRDSTESRSNEMKEFYRTQAKENQDKKQALLDEFYSRQNEYFKPAIEMRNKFKDLGKKHLNK